MNKDDTVKSIKGFDAALQCLGYQFKIGERYAHKGVIKFCKNGFHACPVEHHPLSVFEYYSPAGSRFFEVTQSGKTSADGNKLASAVITIDCEISIGDLVSRAWDYVWSRCIKADESHVVGDYGAASSTGDQGAASSTGDQGAASSTGNYGAATASGYDGKVMGAMGNALFAVERCSKYSIVSVASGIVGQGGLEPHVWYKCVGGKLVIA